MTATNEQKAAVAFSGQAPVFDELYNSDTIINYKRDRVRKHVLRNLTPVGSILELNCGTGEDAIYFAGKGYKVHATDISGGMLYQLVQKVGKHKMNKKISFELCSYTHLEELKNKGPFDMIFSNFAGLNCTGDLDKVLASLSALLNPNGLVTFVILPKFCLWETLLLFKGKFRTAFRRFFSGRGRKARVEGNYFKCWYYNPSYITQRLNEDFDLIGIEGLCTIVPPSYMEGFAKKHPSSFKFLRKWENRLKTKWPWKYIGDYYIISLRKK
ncbi:MAG TPA: class I SAM-dependent methyltransferase [Mucilaginibacter sp.]|jgi:ubiquinone/menaquinone biosynthesis C-methylase UbiE|nr:class I SAM-dependent methyltransferase [Mucilaginibacter sp.]